MQTYSQFILIKSNIRSLWGHTLKIFLFYCHTYYRVWIHSTVIVAHRFYGKKNAFTLILMNVLLVSPSNVKWWRLRKCLSYLQIWIIMLIFFRQDAYCNMFIGCTEKTNTTTLPPTTTTALTTTEAPQTDSDMLLVIIFFVICIIVLFLICLVKKCSNNNIEIDINYEMVPLNGS